ncbi:MAG: phosphotransferase, partial [Polyangiaceae bacterium]
MDKETSARRALERYEGLAEASIVPLQGGLINQTFRVDGASDRFVLQRVNAIFDPRIHDNIEAVTACLEAHGWLTPKLVRARDGECFVTQADGQVWRLMTYIDGVGHARVERTEQAAEAGRLVGRFHTAVDALEHEFVGCRVGV